VAKTPVEPDNRQSAIAVVPVGPDKQRCSASWLSARMTDPERDGDLQVSIDSRAGDWNIDEFVVQPHPPRPSADELMGRALLRLRLYANWSQRDLERASGVDQTTICRFETGHGANIGSRRIAAMLRSLHAHEVMFLPRPPAAPPTNLELMLHGDLWARAMREADRRLSRRRSA
jgi:transcriptional regulator with XRE-family HTH domain